MQIKFVNGYLKKSLKRKNPHFLVLVWFIVRFCLSFYQKSVLVLNDGKSFFKYKATWSSLYHTIGRIFLILFKMFGTKCL